MARPRKDLSDILHTICENVYFQPPTGYKIKYPCIIYDLVNMNVRRADNTPYVTYDEYQIKYITRDPEDPARHEIMKLQYCSPERFYTAENLYHYPFRLYW